MRTMCTRTEKWEEWEQNKNKHPKVGQKRKNDIRTRKLDMDGNKLGRTKKGNKVGNKNPKLGQRMGTKWKKNLKVGQEWEPKRGTRIRNKIKWKQKPKTGTRMGTKWKKAPKSETKTGTMSKREQTWKKEDQVPQSGTRIETNSEQEPEKSGTRMETKWEQSEKKNSKVGKNGQKVQ